MTDLLGRLVEANVFKIGEFKLKTGALSPIYIDLRGIVAYPKLVGKLAEAVNTLQKKCGIEADAVCGVPYTALPIASVYSHLFDIRMVVKRKEAKNYGTKRMVEGVTGQGGLCLVIEDIVTSGSSVIETVNVLRREGMIVTECITILDRQQGGAENLRNAGVRLHSIFTASDIFQRYCIVKDVDPGLVTRVESYLKGYIPPLIRCRLPFKERARTATQPVMKRLLEIAAAKQTNLCVAVDVVHSDDLLRLADSLGPHICLLKTHIDILLDFDDSVTRRLHALATRHDFLLFEDRKFADIGNTVMHQYVNGLYRIQQWADIVTVHSVPGGGILEALEKGASCCERACVLVAEMSSKGALTDDTYRSRTEEMALGHLDYVIGFISQNTLSVHQGLIHMCPGVSIASSSDSLGQQYKTPEEAVANGADIVIVGRGICEASDVVSAALEYKTRAYGAYLQNCNKK